MTTHQLEKQISTEVHSLSKEELLEVLSFIRLKKKSVTDIQKELSKLSFDQEIHLEEEIKNYKSLYPVE